MNALPRKPQALTQEQRDRIAQRQLREQDHPLLQPLGARQPRRKVATLKDMKR